MPELLIHVWVQLVGTGLMMVASPGLAAAAPFAGYPVGLAAYVALASVLLLLPVPFDPLAILAFLSLIIAFGVLKRRPRVDRSVRIGLAIMVFLIAATVFVAQSLKLARLSYDSIEMIQLSAALRNTTDYWALPINLLLSRPLFVPLAHTLAEPAGNYYLPALAPVFGMTTAIAFGWVTTRVVGPARKSRQLAFAALAIAAAYTPYFVIWQFFYVNGHLMVGFYLVLYVATTWLVVVRAERQWLLLSPLVLYSLTLLRLESPLLMALFLAPLLLLPDIGLHIKRLHGIAYLLAVVLWFGIVIGMRGTGGAISSEASVPGMLIIAGLVGVSLVGVHHESICRGASKLLPLAPLAAVVAVAAAFLLDPDHMRTSYNALLQNMLDTGNWGLTWLVLVPTVLVGAVLARFPYRQLWTVPLLTFFPLTFALSYFRVPFRLGWGDSANRMLTHVLLIAVLFLVLVLADLVRKDGHRDLTARDNDSSETPVADRFSLTEASQREPAPPGPAKATPSSPSHGAESFPTI